MEFRRIKETEQEQAIYIISQAFYYDCDGEYKQLEKGVFRYEDFMGAFGDDGKMIACIQNEPHFMWLDGNSVKSGGICNVASLPEYRRGGAVRKLMKLQCDTMYDDGYTMSYLYPFSHPYYRKFGYELCCGFNVFNASPKDLLKLNSNGTAKQFEPGENGTDPEDIIRIYTAFASNFNIMLDRDAWQWERKLEHDPVKTKTRTYIVYDEKGIANGYFTFVHNRQGNTADLTILDLAWTDYDGMYNLFAFIGKFFGNVKKISFNVPPNMIPEYLWQEPWNVEITYKHSGMARIINAKKTLELIKKPNNDGSFTIKINDSFLEQNNKSYVVTWDSDNTEVKEFEGDCDIECSIMALAQILTGFIGLDTAIIRNDVTIDNNLELLQEVFHKKLVFIADFF